MIKGALGQLFVVANSVSISDGSADPNSAAASLWNPKTAAERALIANFGEGEKFCISKPSSGELDFHSQCKSCKKIQSLTLHAANVDMDGVEEA